MYSVATDSIPAVWPYSYPGPRVELQVGGGSQVDVEAPGCLRGFPHSEGGRAAVEGPHTREQGQE